MMATLNGMGGWDLSDDDIKEMQDLGMVAKDESDAMTPAEMSKMLFCAREQLSMWSDVWISAGKRDMSLEGLIEQIDAYRASKGWSPSGFGGEV